MRYEYDAEKLEEEDDGDDGIQVGIETFICLCHGQHLRAVHLLSPSPGKGHQGNVLIVMRTGIGNGQKMNLHQMSTEAFQLKIFHIQPKILCSHATL